MDVANTTVQEVSIYSLATLTVNILYYSLLPLQKLINFAFVILLAVLQPIWAAVSFLLLPVTYLASLFAQVVSIPVSLLVKSETLYTFFGTAVLLGAFAGAMLHLLSSLTLSVLQLDSVQTGHGSNSLRSVEKYRASRESRRGGGLTDQPRQSTKNASRSSSSALSHPRIGSRRGRQNLMLTKQEPVKRELLTSTILEEDDSEEFESGT